MKNILKSNKIKANIHTIAILTNKAFPENIGGITNMRFIPNEKTGEIKFLSKINIKEYFNERVINLSDYKEKLNIILEQYEIDQYNISRVDFNFDCEENNYNEMMKINKLIILLLSLKYNIKKRYQSFEPLTYDNLTIRIQSEYYEAENYNKEIESNSMDEAKNRFELRSKALAKRNKSIEQLLTEWCYKLDSVMLSYVDLQNKANESLFVKWKSEKGKEVKSVSEFIRKYQQNFYTVKQLVEFYKLIGANNPAQSAYNFNSKNDIEYISISDLNIYINVLKKSAEKFIA